jgi:hypothetical protein
VDKLVRCTGKKHAYTMVVGKMKEAEHLRYIDGDYNGQGHP